MLLNHLSLAAYVPNEPFFSNVTVSFDWTHVVLNYVGSKENKQIGTSVEIVPQGGGRIVIGKVYTEVDYCGSVQVDELLFFDKSLSSSEIQMLGEL